LTFTEIPPPEPFDSFAESVEPATEKLLVS